MKDASDLQLCQSFPENQQKQFVSSEDAWLPAFRATPSADAPANPPQNEFARKAR